MRNYLLSIIVGLFIVTTVANKVFAEPKCYCQPNQSCWPTKTEWTTLSKQLKGQLVQPVNPLDSCKENINSATCKTALKNMHNPYFIQNNPGATQSQGWLNAWENQQSTYAVEAANTHDIVAAVNFARLHHIKLVIKGASHDYLGRNNAANSLLIWTHKMRDIKLDNAFIPAGCAHTQKGMPVVTVGAGTRWIETFTAVTTKNNRYVQGGGCASVGSAGGFIQGGGFGSFSKRFGTGAAGMVEAEIVTADGKVLIANQCQNKDLFWAVRGGGGSTFGVVSKVTLKTHPLPTYFGGASGTITAKDDAAFKKLILQFLTFYRDNLNNEHWGEQFRFNTDNTIALGMVFQDLTNAQAKKVWEPLQAWIKQHSNDYKMQLTITTVPARKWWDYDYLKKHLPNTITINTEKNAPTGQFWWSSNTDEVSKYWYTYQSWWVPRVLFDDANIQHLSDVIFTATRLTHVTLHANKGLAGGNQEAIANSRDTSFHPSSLDAAALIIIGAGSNDVYPSVVGLKQPDKEAAKKIVANINDAMKLFHDLAPNAGAYANEADYFQPDWQQAFWGNNYSKLYEIKQKYDPEGVFYCHHCVGSERFDENGMCLQ